jgi:hypothetical protein
MTFLIHFFNALLIYNIAKTKFYNNSETFFNCVKMIHNTINVAILLLTTLLSVFIFPQIECCPAVAAAVGIGSAEVGAAVVRIFFNRKISKIEIIFLNYFY